MIIRHPPCKTLDRVERVTQRANEVRGALEGEMREKYRSGS